MKKILNKYPKADIASLPIVAFPGRIITVESEQEADKAVDYLLSQSILGFDTETKPNFTRGGMNPVALLQVSSKDTCFLFRLNHIGSVTDSIARLLSDTEVLKIGLSWHDDLHQLTRRRSFKPGTFVELQKMVSEFGIKDLSLQKLYANVFGQKISKSQQLTNWEADTLKDSQKLYAATDAWACIMLYEELQRMRLEGYMLEMLPEPEPILPETLAVVQPKEKKVKERKPRTRKNATNNSEPASQSQEPQVAESETAAGEAEHNVSKEPKRRVAKPRTTRRKSTSNSRKKSTQQQAEENNGQDTVSQER